MERALPSVQAQTHENLEILVAAHGCTDGTVEAVRALGDKRIRVLEVPRKRSYPPSAENHWLAGPVAPCNVALSVARGGWVARLDDDDIWEPYCLQVLLDFALVGNFEFVSAAHKTHEGKVEPYAWNDTRVGGIQTCLYRSYLRFFRYNPACWRKAWYRVNDVDLQRRMLRAGVHMGYVDRVVARVLPRPGEKTVGSKAYTDEPERAEQLMAFSPD